MESKSKEVEVQGQASSPRKEAKARLCKFVTVRLFEEGVRLGGLGIVYLLVVPTDEAGFSCRPFVLEVD